MSNTPRTDAAQREVDVAYVSADGLASAPEMLVDPDFARTLERDNAALRARLAEVKAENKRMTLMLSAFSVNPDRIGQCEIAQARASNDAMWDTLNQLREARTDLARWRTVADGLAEQLQQKEGYGPVADLREYNAAKKGTT
jgi:hypothetical protein